VAHDALTAEQMVGGESRLPSLFLFGMGKKRELITQFMATPVLRTPYGINCSISQGAALDPEKAVPFQSLSCSPESLADSDTLGRCFAIRYPVFLTLLSYGK